MDKELQNVHLYNCNCGKIHEECLDLKELLEHIINDGAEFSPGTIDEFKEQLRNKYLK